MKRKMEEPKVKKKGKEFVVDARQSFFKIILPIPRNLERLQIPPEFITHIDKRVFEQATLRDTFGSCWRVKLYENEKGVYIKDGWNMFFKAHCLGHLELLLFIYDGKLSFDVRIFGKDGIEKNITTRNSGPNKSVAFDYYSDDIKNESEEVYDASPKRVFVPANARRKRRIKSSDEEMDHFEFKDIEDNEAKLSKKGENMRLEGSNTGLRRSGSHSFRLDKSKNVKKFEQKEMSKAKMQKDQIEIIGMKIDYQFKKFKDSEANSSQVKECSRLPSFEKCLDAYHVKIQYMFGIPQDFAEKYLPSEKTTMILRNEQGKYWAVNFIPIEHLPRLCKGWVTFMRDNKLKLRDCIRFELVKENEMQVYIIRSS